MAEVIICLNSVLLYKGYHVCLSQMLKVFIRHVHVLRSFFLHSKRYKKIICVVLVWNVYGIFKHNNP